MTERGPLYWLTCAAATIAGAFGIGVFALGVYGLWVRTGLPADRSAAAAAFLIAGSVVPIVIAVVLADTASEMRKRRS